MDIIYLCILSTLFSFFLLGQFQKRFSYLMNYELCVCMFVCALCMQQLISHFIAYRIRYAHRTNVYWLKWFIFHECVGNGSADECIKHYTVHHNNLFTTTVDRLDCQKWLLCERCTLFWTIDEKKKKNISIFNQTISHCIDDKNIKFQWKQNVQSKAKHFLHEFQKFQLYYGFRITFSFSFDLNWFVSNILIRNKSHKQTHYSAITGVHFSGLFQKLNFNLIPFPLSYWWYRYCSFHAFHSLYLSMSLLLSLSHSFILVDIMSTPKINFHLPTKYIHIHSTEIDSLVLALLSIDVISMLLSV